MITPLSEALAERGYDKLTPVQEACSDPDLVNVDLLVSAQTGSGKTVGFGIAIAPTLLGEDDKFGSAENPQALIITPTRELALQVMRELQWLYAKTGARFASCVGGMDMRDERRALGRGAHIVVGTPGRLRDHIMRGSLVMSELDVVVLDEADEMLDLGFRDDLEFMLGEAPKDRRTLMFSATVPQSIAKLAQSYQRDAKRISTIGGGNQHSDISYHALRVANSDSEKAIFNLLRYHDDESAIVFANTRAAVNHLTARLANRGFSVVCLSGELSQSERTHALQAMRDGRANVCVATDVAARGIDLPNLNLVIHADLPTNQESLLHRSGRTGRAGRKGISALIVPPKKAKLAQRLLKWAKIDAEWREAPSAEMILERDESRLLEDPAWGEEIAENQKSFIEKLVAEHSAEAIAAAFLRLYRSRKSAPEELRTPEDKPERREHKEFGPSTWFSLSVGRDDRAEPRWLLPLLCRAGNIDKNAIGAIRVQQAETFVELTDASIAGFLASLDGDILEDGVKVTQLQGAPKFQPSKSFKPNREGSGGDRPRGGHGGGGHSGGGQGGDRPRGGHGGGGGNRHNDDRPRSNSKPPRKPRHDDDNRGPKQNRDKDLTRTHEGAVKAPGKKSKGPKRDYNPTNDDGGRSSKSGKPRFDKGKSDGGAKPYDRKSGPAKSGAGKGGTDGAAGPASKGAKYKTRARKGGESKPHRKG